MGEGSERITSSATRDGSLYMDSCSLPVVLAMAEVHLEAVLTPCCAKRAMSMAACSATIEECMEATRIRVSWLRDNASAS